MKKIIFYQFLFFVTFYFHFPSLFGSVVLDIQTIDIEESTIMIAKFEKSFHLVSAKLESEKISPSRFVRLDETQDNLIIKIDGIEIGFPSDFRENLLSFLKMDRSPEIDCSKFCSFIYKIQTNLEEDDTVDFKPIRNSENLISLQPGDVVVIGSIVGEMYTSHHYAIYLQSGLLLSKFGSYLGLGVTSLPTLISMYHNQNGTLRLYRFYRQGRPI